jgi:hypothetical protein
MDILQVQDRLKNFSQDQLVGEMQSPTGNAPQFLVLSEIMRRKRLQDDYAAQQGKAGSETTVAQEAVAAAGVPQGGIADMARSMAPSTDMTQNTGVQAMASGGTVKKMAEGDVVVRGGIQYVEQADGSYMSEDGTRTMMTPGQEISRDFYNLPSRLGSLFGNASAGLADEANATLMDQYRASQGRTAAAMRAGPDTSYQYPEVPTVDVTEMDRAALAEDVMSGRAGTQTGFPSAYEQYVQNQMAAVDAAQPRFPPEAFNPMSVYGMRAGPDTSYQYPEVPTVDVTDMDRAALAEDVMSGRAGPMTAMPPTYVDPGAGPIEAAMSRAAMLEAASNRAGPMTAMAAQVPAQSVNPMTEFQEDFGGPPAEGPVPGVMERIFGAPALERIGVETSRTPKPVPTPDDRGAAIADRRAGLEGVAAAAAKADEEAKAAEEAAAAEAVTVSTSGGGAGGGGGGIAGAASGMTSYEQELVDALARREKAATQDKWLALAQVGLNLMSSTQPTLGGAIGEAGLAGVQAAQGSRDQYEQDRLELTGALEQSRMSRAKAVADAAKGAGGSGGISDPYEISAGTGRLLTQMNNSIEQLSAVVDDPMIKAQMAAEGAPPEDVMAYANMKADLEAKKRLRDSILYGAPMTQGSEDDTNIDGADE